MSNNLTFIAEASTGFPYAFMVYVEQVGDCVSFLISFLSISLRQ